MSEEQCAIQEALVARYEAIRSGKVKPWQDNALAITTDGRKLATRCPAALCHGDGLFPTRRSMPWWRTSLPSGSAPCPRAAPSFIFADLGIHPTPWGYAVYADVITKLVQHGVPRQDIAAIGDADTDAKKHVLFEQVRQGTVRILLAARRRWAPARIYRNALLHYTI